MLEFRILGSVDIIGPRGTFAVRGAIQRSILATLLVSNSQIIMAETLKEEIWGRDLPRNADNALQAHMSRLRRTLSRAEPDRRAADRLVCASSGYRLQLDDAGLDAAVVVRTIDRVRNCDLHPADATRLLRDALGLYRGPALPDATRGLICQSAAIRYEEYRIEALELVHENNLCNGLHTQIVAELSELVESHPLNERLSQHLMVALYRSGRQTAALDVYQRLRSRLIEELGLEPSPALRRYESAILAHDPILLLDDPRTREGRRAAACD